MEAEVKTQRQSLEALRHQGNALVEILNEYKQEKETFSKELEDLQEINVQERDLLRDERAGMEVERTTFEERWAAMEQRMTVVRDDNIRVGFILCI